MGCVFVSSRQWSKTSMSVKRQEWLRNRHMIVFLQVHGGIGEDGNVDIFSKVYARLCESSAASGTSVGVVIPGIPKKCDLRRAYVLVVICLLSLSAILTNPP